MEDHESFFRLFICGLLFISWPLMNVNAQSGGDTIILNLVFEDPSKPTSIVAPLPQSLDSNNYELFFPSAIDPNQKFVIESVTVNPAKIIVTPSSTRNITLTFKTIPGSGVYLGNLIAKFLVGTKKDSVLVPVKLLAHSPNDLRLMDLAPRMSINYVKGLGFINGILPKLYNQDQASVSAINGGYFPLTRLIHTQSIKGVSSNSIIPDTQLLINYTYVERGMPFDIVLDLNEISVKADHYTGAIYLQDYPGHAYDKVDVIINVRNGVLGAFLVLILGAFFGWMARKVEASTEQLLLYDDLRKLRNIIVNTLKIENDVQDILRSIDILLHELSIGLRPFEELRKDYEGLLKQTEYARMLNECEIDLKNLIENGLAIDVTNQMEGMLATMRVEYTKGNYVAFDLSLLSFKDLVAQQMNLKGINFEMEQNPAFVRTLLAEDILHEKWYETLLFKITGMDAIVNFYRPIVWIVTMVFSLLGVFYEAYIVNGESFGADGIFDYIKLFLYGTSVVVAVDQVLKNFVPGLQARISSKQL